ncbi:MAG TPA: hypothetical protein VHB47_20830 [Thermoanaerobaculia bacterium]|nr:hypothetical protein [Thermoanaerobaculia bacterium]
MNARTSGRAAEAPESSEDVAPDTQREGPPTLILDLGAARKKRVAQLRKGRGKLMAEVSSELDDLRRQGKIDSHAQPVVVIVKQKRKRRGPLDMLPFKLK